MSTPSQPSISEHQADLRNILLSDCHTVFGAGWGLPAHINLYVNLMYSTAISSWYIKKMFHCNTEYLNSSPMTILIQHTSPSFCFWKSPIILKLEMPESMHWGTDRNLWLVWTTEFTISIQGLSSTFVFVLFFQVMWVDAGLCWTLPKTFIAPQKEWWKVSCVSPQCVWFQYLTNNHNINGHTNNLVKTICGIFCFRCSNPEISAKMKISTFHWYQPLFFMNWHISTVQKCGSFI